METVQGYVILKAATFETGHGFALGHNPGAPSPFVTWQFTEGENGHRDYYWGRYGTSQAWRCPFWRLCWCSCLIFVPSC